MPLISVVIPVKDRPVMLKRAVCSVLDQDFSDYELIVVDDGSSLSLDDSREIVLSKGHLWITLDENKGVSAARNRGVSESSGEFISFLDSDDLWHSNKLSAQYQYHLDNSHYQISQCEERWIKNGQEIKKKKIHRLPLGDIFKKSVRMCSISPSSVMLTRELFDEHGGFDNELPVCEDYDLWLKIASQHEVGRIDDCLVTKHGGHGDQLSSSVRAIDRYRVYVLHRLLANSVLTQEQREIVVEEISRKLGILRKGALKHAPETAVQYESIEAFVKNGFATVG